MENENPKNNSDTANKPTAIIITGVLIAGALIVSSVILSGEKYDKMTSQEGGNLLAQVEESIGKDIAKKCSTGEQKYKDLVNEDSASGKIAGARGTPYSVMLLKDGTTIVIPGALPFEDIENVEGEIMIGMKTRVSSILSIIRDGKDLSAIAEDINLSPVTEDDHIMGNKNAEIIIVEYSDIDCPFCKRFHPTMKKLVDEFDGQVAWVYRHFPLDELHPEAREKAEISECVADSKGEEAFWKYLDSVIY